MGRIKFSPLSFLTEVGSLFLSYMHMRISQKSMGSSCLWKYCSFLKVNRTATEAKRNSPVLKPCLRYLSNIGGLFWGMAQNRHKLIWYKRMGHKCSVAITWIFGTDISFTWRTPKLQSCNLGEGKQLQSLGCYMKEPKQPAQNPFPSFAIISMLFHWRHLARRASWFS